MAVYAIASEDAALHRLVGLHQLVKIAAPKVETGLDPSVRNRSQEGQERAGLAPGLGLAPPSVLVASIARHSGRRSLGPISSAQAASKAALFQRWLGRDPTIFQLRAMLDGQLAQTVIAYRHYLEAAAMVRLEIRAETMRNKSAPTARGA